MGPQHQISLGDPLVQPLGRSRPPRRSAQLVALLFATQLASACAGAGASSSGSSSPKTTTYHVAADGDDGDAGDADAPFATIGRALRMTDAGRIKVAAGRYREDVDVARGVRIVGTQKSVVEGTLRIQGARVEIDGLQVRGAVRVEGGDLTAKRLRVEGLEADTLTVQDGRGQFEELELSCGTKACLHARSATVSVRGGQLEGGPETAHGVRGRDSQLTLEKIGVSGGRQAQIQVTDGSRLRIDGAQLSASRGTAIIAIQSKVRGAQVNVHDGADQGLVVSRSQARFVRSTFGASRSWTLGQQGGELRLQGCTVGPGPRGAINVSGYRGQGGRLTMNGGEVRHGDSIGLAVGQGHARVEGVRFTGRPGAEKGDAISASGETAKLDLVSASIASPAGFGVGLYNNAIATITATITDPALGGVVVQSSPGGAVVVKDTRITGCGAGPGLAAFDVMDLKVDGLHISGCKAGAVVAGERARAEITSATLVDNGDVGIAAYGGAQIRVGDSRIKAGRWATYAACATGGYIHYRPGNRLAGRASRCP